MRISQKVLAAQFANVATLAQRAGVAEAAQWVLYRGTAVYSVVTVDPDTGGHRTVLPYIGTTRGEAHKYLSAMREAYLLVLREEQS